MEIFNPTSSKCVDFDNKYLLTSGEYMMLDIKRLRQKYFYKLKDELYSVNTASEIYFALPRAAVKPSCPGKGYADVARKGRI